MQKRARKKNYIWKSILASILIGMLIFVSGRPMLVEAATFSDEELNLFLLQGDLDVDTEVAEDGFRQIKYIFEDEDVVITDENYTNADPDAYGEYITWMGLVGSAWQIFLHHVPSEETLQLTTIGNNVNPSINGDNVVWEGQVLGVWQIFVFDGIRTKQITSGNSPSQEVGVEVDYVVYAQKDEGAGGWRVFLYQVSTSETTNLTPDSFGKAPRISNGIVTWKTLIDEETVEFHYGVFSKTFFDSVVPEVVDVDVSVVDTVDIVEVVEEVEDNTAFNEEAYEEYLSTLESEPVVEPEEVTVEDIEEELGISPDDSTESISEQDVSSDSNVVDETVESQEVTETQESTESTSAGL